MFLIFLFLIINDPETSFRLWIHLHTIRELGSPRHLVAKCSQFQLSLLYFIVLFSDDKASFTISSAGRGLIFLSCELFTVHLSFPATSQSFSFLTLPHTGRKERKTFLLSVYEGMAERHKGYTKVYFMKVE